LKGGEIVKRIKALPHLVMLYAHKMVKVVQMVTLDFEQHIATTDQEQDRAVEKFFEVLEVLEVLDDMIEQAKAEVFEK
jgi:hypothetical protein